MNKENGVEIQRLSLRLGTLIRASSIISSLHNATEELILNSIDAQSSSMELYVDFLNHNIKIIDNGACLKNSYLFCSD
jgi:DNA mismatch repair ATPase MutL